MKCPRCGTEVPDGTKFCTQCGAPLGMLAAPAGRGMPAAPVGQGAPINQGAPIGQGAPSVSPDLAARPAPAAQVPAERRPSSAAHVARTVVITVVVCLALVGGGTAGYVAWQNARQQEAYEAAHGTHAVTLELTAPHFDTSTGSKLPVHVTGTNADGSVDEVQFVDDSGHGLSLARGSYELSFPASPISADGELFEVPSGTASLDIGEDVAPGAEVKVSTTSALEMNPVKDPSSVSNDQIAQALDYASRDGACPDGVSAQTLADAATRHRDDAVAEKRQAAAHKTTRYDAAFAYFGMPDSWQGKVNVQATSNTSGMFHIDVYLGRGTGTFVWRIDGQKNADGSTSASNMTWDAPSGGAAAEAVWNTRHGATAQVSADEAETWLDLTCGSALTAEQVGKMGSAGEAKAAGDKAAQQFLSSVLAPSVEGHPAQ